jgi:hypothetical protein
MPPTLTASLSAPAVAELLFATSENRVDEPTTQESEKGEQQPKKT